jgi:hypothetical protein
LIRWRQDVPEAQTIGKGLLASFRGVFPGRRARSVRPLVRFTATASLNGIIMKYKLSAAILAATLCLSSAAMAQTVREACGPDIQRFCSGVGPMKIKACMKKHMKDLSPVCIGTLVKMKQSQSQQ